MTTPHREVGNPSIDTVTHESSEVPVTQEQLGFLFRCRCWSGRCEYGLAFLTSSWAMPGHGVTDGSVQGPPPHLGGGAQPVHLEGGHGDT